MMARQISNARRTARSFGGALSFDGVDDRVTVAGIVPAVTGFSLGLWVYWLGGRVLSSAKVLVSCEGGNGGFSITHSSPNTGKVRFGVIDNSVTTVQIFSTNPLEIGWNHVAVTYAVNEAKLYINGVQNEATDTSASMSAPSQTFTIGRGSGGTQPFMGIIDQFVFKNSPTPWTAEEVDQLYRVGTIPGTPTCTLLFNDGSGTNVADSSGNGNNGTILGSAAWTTFVPSRVRGAANGRTTAGTRTVV